MNFSPKLIPYTVEGRERIHQKIRPDIEREIGFLMKSRIPNRSVEYMDNRISRYSMKMGKCEITGIDLSALEVHCHHYIPLHLGGTDTFHNLRILHKEVHKLIHHTDKEAINVLINRLGITKIMVDKINKYREKCELERI
ncbi:HNH endonuclease signature motif containing protein [Metabacillus herbersteinensis]|uniref:HNH endonuclease signature motif containing protein n=1 Tax=Metabacillus herbersteinensis TaxID=283816 RepID=UPI00366E416A